VSPFANVSNLGSKGCFYIKSTNKDDSGKEFVLEASTMDKYAPKTTGVFNVDMQLFDKKAPKKTQQWSYDASTHSLHSLQYPDKVMFESFNRNLIVFSYKPGMKNEAFSFDLDHQNWYNVHTHRVLQLSTNDTISTGSEVLTDDFNPKSLAQKWTIVDCVETAKAGAKEAKDEEKTIKKEAEEEAKKELKAEAEAAKAEAKKEIL
jgi:hypothetical protein